MPGPTASPQPAHGEDRADGRGFGDAGGDGTFRPVIVPTGERGLRVTGLSACGLPVRDGRAPLWRMHEVPCGGMALFAFPPAIGRTIDTTNALDCLNRSLRKAIDTRGGFACDAAAATLLYIAIRQAGLRCKPITAWSDAKPRFTILSSDQGAVYT